MSALSDAAITGGTHIGQTMSGSFGQMLGSFWVSARRGSQGVLAQPQTFPRAGSGSASARGSTSGEICWSRQYTCMLGQRASCQSMQHHIVFSVYIICVSAGLKGSMHLCLQHRGKASYQVCNSCRMYGGAGSV